MIAKAARLAEFIQRLWREAPFASGEAAFEALVTVLNAVEDRHAAAAFDPARWRIDGRMYPPQADASRAVPGRPELTRWRTRRHNIWIATGGAIRIEEVGGRCFLEKAGADGRMIGPIGTPRPPSPSSAS